MLNQPFYDPRKTYEENFEQGPFGELLSSVLVEQKGEPEHNFLGQKVYTPFGIAAGPLPNSKFVDSAFKAGFDICTYKTVRSRGYPCNPWPNVVPVEVRADLNLAEARIGVKIADEFKDPLTITNSFGVPSRDPDFWQKDMNKAVLSAKTGQVLVGSFQGTGGGSEESYQNDFVRTAKLVKETGAKILEANLSCPNEGKSDLLCFDVEKVKRIAFGIKNEIGNTPLILKIAYFENEGLLQKLVEEVGNIVEGFEAINTIYAKIVSKAGDLAFQDGRTHSGLCGAGIKWAGLEMTKRLYTLREKLNLKYTIIGVGGVMNVRDYLEYIQNGADAVMSATGAMWNAGLGKEVRNAEF